MNEEQTRKAEFLNRSFYADTKVKALEALRDKNLSIVERYEKCTAEHDVLKDQIRIQNEKIMTEIKKMMSYRDETQKAISNIKNDKYGILESILSMRYLSFMSMQDIADAIGYDRKTIQRKHKIALDSLDITTTTVN